MLITLIENSIMWGEGKMLTFSVAGLKSAVVQLCLPGVLVSLRQLGHSLTLQTDWNACMWIADSSNTQFLIESEGTKHWDKVFIEFNS